MKSENIDSNENYSDEISLRELISEIKKWFRYILSKWAFILIFGLIGGGLGYLYANSIKPLYVATTTFVLEDEKSGTSMGALSGLASIAGLDLNSGGGGMFQGANILELYKSRKMIDQTLLTPVLHDGKKELLIDRYIEINKLREGWKEKPKLKNLQFSVDSTQFRSKDGKLQMEESRLRDSVMGSIVKNIKKNYLLVDRLDKKLSIIKADVKSTDEFFSKAFNEAIVKNVNEFYISTKTKKTLANVKILQQKVDSVSGVLNGAIYTAAAVSDATPNLNPTRQIQRIVPIQRSQYTAETNKAILSSLVQNLEMSKVAMTKDAPLLQVIDEPVYPLDKEGFGKLKGIILGGVIFGFLTVLFLSVKLFFKKILSE